MDTALTSVSSCLDSGIYWINIYPVDYNAIGFRNTYPLDSDYIPANSHALGVSLTPAG